MSLETFRRHFPVALELAYLNNAAESPLNRLVQTRLMEYLDLAAKAPHQKPGVRNEVRRLLSTLLGGQSEDYALVGSTGIGLNIVANGYGWQPGDNVVVPIDEHWNNTFPWFALQQKGVEVRLAPLDGKMRVDMDKLAGMIDGKTRIVACAAVRHTTGYRADLKSIASMAHHRGAIFAVDGIQAAGVMPLNVMDDGIDVLASAGFKWLLGQPGTGFLYVNSRARERISPVLPGMFAAEDNLRELRYFDDSRRFETGTMAYPLFHAWTAGLELLIEMGVKNIHERVLLLTDQLIQGLQNRKITLVSPVEHRSERSAILSFTLGSPEKNQDLFNRLTENRVSISIRDGRCRISPSFFNTQEEIDKFLSLV